MRNIGPEEKKGLNLFVGLPRNVKHTLFSNGGHATGRIRENLALCGLTDMTDLSNMLHVSASLHYRTCQFKP
ncbi:hypothetical protein AV530_010331 [Patagioenas fasciata monilis]|uniref:Uncharacterized protein n=1 Tax=Patagioenas fasciata monilis TaxID=372326 RepID=A0A1V4KEN7_PATFA|nr:hypothetical protein AV530_010331 [Patagioenas fasciata monilis]